MTRVLPDDVLIELALPDIDRRFRVMLDGRYLIREGGAERQATPMSRPERGSQIVSKTGRSRIEATLRDADFMNLPPFPDATVVEDGEVILPGGARLEPMRVVIAARLGDAVHRVEVRGDPKLPSSLGPLEPVYVALDHEALGDWVHG